MSESELIPFQVSDKIRMPQSVPYVSFSLKGSSYINKKAARLLNLEHLDCVMFYRLGDRWFMENNSSAGCTINKSGGLFKFCNLPLIRNIFQVYEIKGHKAYFKTGTEIEVIDGKKLLLIIPKPFNTVD